ncbi:MAG: hypothetical protein J6A89_02930 [Clostridia bacterium]|nr:hypothetical protein [Clostridia bacterium]
MKNKKYKTLKLLIIFILIVIAALFSVNHIKKLIAENKTNDIKTNMLIIQGKIKLLKGQSEVNNNEENYVGTKVSNLDNQQIKQLMQNLKIEESKYENYYILNKENFDQMEISAEIKNIENHVYIVNYNEAEVIYTKGIIINNETKYKLSDIMAKEPEKEWILYNRIGD